VFEELDMEYVGVRCPVCDLKEHLATQKISTGLPSWPSKPGSVGQCLLCNVWEQRFVSVFSIHRVTVM